MYGHRSQPPLTRVAFAARMFHHFLLAIGFVVLSLAGGMVGQLTFGEGCVFALCISQCRHAAWRHGSYRAPPKNSRWQDFAGLYARDAGLFFSGDNGCVIRARFHRLLHRFHWEESSSNAVRQKTKPPKK